MKNPVLSLEKCYAILGLAQGAGLDDIKRAYRKRAFELHPDLNPSDGASSQFQQLNEAYVILIRLMDTTSATTQDTGSNPEADATSAKAGRAAYREQARRERTRDEQDRKERKARQEAERRERENLNRQAREQRERQEKEQLETERRERLRREIERQEAERIARRQHDRMEKERRAETRRQAEREHEEKLREATRAEVHRRSYARPQTPGSSAGPEHAGSTARASEAAGAPGAATSSTTSRNTVPPTGPPSSAGTPTSASQAAGAYSSINDREGLLNDLLHDPFARRVYEDIYREVQNRKDGSVITPRPVPGPPEEDVSLQPAEIAKNMGKAVKSWLQSQIDEEQEMFFPASKLFPGARIRLQIRRGLTGELKTVDITLPPDFAVGKVVRLKGMGKKIGRWQGDLYLTFQIK